VKQAARKWIEKQHTVFEDQSLFPYDEIALVCTVWSDFVLRKRVIISCNCSDILCTICPIHYLRLRLWTYSADLFCSSNHWPLASLLNVHWCFSAQERQSFTKIYQPSIRPAKDLRCSVTINHIYTDVTHRCHPCNFDSIITHIQNATERISCWMIATLLTLKSSKMEFPLIGLE